MKNDLLSIDVIVKPYADEGQVFTFDTEFQANLFVSKMTKVGIPSNTMTVVRYYAGARANE